MKSSFIRPPPSGLPGGGRSLRGQMMRMLRFLRIGGICRVHCGICLRLRRRWRRRSATTPVMECPQGQVGTYPDCMDPPPTDEERIAEARNTIAGIVTQANAIEQAARSAVTAVESNPDATNEDIADARSHGNAALDALRAIIRASGVANAATTGAQAEGAVDERQRGARQAECRANGGGGHPEPCGSGWEPA